MDESRYQAYINEMKQADELHALLVSIAKEEDWEHKYPSTSLSSSHLHAFAAMKGLITRDERNLLYRFYSR